MTTPQPKFSVGQRVKVDDCFDSLFGECGIVRRPWWDSDGWRYTVEFANGDEVDFFAYELSEVSDDEQR